MEEILTQVFRRNIIWVLGRILPRVLMEFHLGFWKVFHSISSKESQSGSWKQFHLVLERVFSKRNIINRIFTWVKDTHSGSQKDFLLKFVEGFLLGFHGWIFNWVLRLTWVLERIFCWVCRRNSHSGF